jgi:NitT/TauT family transport system permease protein
VNDNAGGRATLTQPGPAVPAAGSAAKTGRHRTFPGRIALRRRANPIDVVIALVIVAVFYGIARLGHSLSVNVTPGSTPSTLPTGISHVPYYAACSLLRMFVALGISTIFTFIYGTAAARLRRAEKLLVAILDILQSVPVLGFLTFTTVFFLHLFGTAGGLEAAAVFAVFTSQAWNMTFSFYHSLKTQPSDLDEAARLYRLTKWQRFWKLDVPTSMIGLVWNAMMSMGGGWFFLTASEAITVSGHQYALPGMGSYIGAAIAAGSLGKVGIAVAVMVLLVVGVNELFFQPLVAWSDKFRMERSESATTSHSAVLDLLRKSHLRQVCAVVFGPVSRALDRITRPFGLAEYPPPESPRRRRARDAVFWGIVGALLAWGAVGAFTYLHRWVGFGAFGDCGWLGAITFVRVAVVVIVSTVIWVPIGAIIGLNPRLARVAQPIVQILASFPANLLFPFLILVFIAIHLPLNFGSILLMAVGAQWYILFNSIAGAIAIPNDLREMSADFRLTRRPRWRQLILPAIFPAYVTGGITAAGGAWNASIVAEVVVWGSHHLSATGLGAYITEASDSAAPDHFAKVLTGVIVMSLYVVLVNRLFWQRLYRLADSHFTL